MKAITLSLLFGFILTGCSGNSGDNGKASAQGGVVLSAQVTSDVEAELSSEPQYQLTASEIESLFNDGVINEQQKQELLALAQ